ncbi:MAG TPA: CAP domain-containing protein [Gaiellaceae bacterium]|nr:CAP domain-containing protein [Gaiellaceae bacterium]
MRAAAVSTFVGLAALALSGNVVAAPQRGGWQVRADASAASMFHALTRLKSAPVQPTIVRSRTSAARPAAPASQSSLLSAYESSVFARINSIRAARGLRPLRVSRGLTAAATYHTTQMGTRGFFEHESANGAPFWRRIERFYPSRNTRSWSVGENILWGSPDISPPSAVREWMLSPPHRENILSREWREIGLAAIHFASAPGEYGGRQVTIVTADFGTRT